MKNDDYETWFEGLPDLQVDGDTDYETWFEGLPYTLGEDEFIGCVIFI